MYDDQNVTPHDDMMIYFKIWGFNRRGKQYYSQHVFLFLAILHFLNFALAHLAPVYGVALHAALFLLHVGALLGGLLPALGPHLPHHGHNIIIS